MHVCVFVFVCVGVSKRVYEEVCACVLVFLWRGRQAGRQAGREGGREGGRERERESMSEWVRVHVSLYFFGEGGREGVEGGREGGRKKERER